MERDENEKRASREYTPEEAQAIRWASALARVSQSDLRSLGHQDSRRGKQRAVALLLGHASGGRIDVWSLRDLLYRLGLENAANYAQDMTKDSDDPTRGRGVEGLWSVNTHRYRRQLSGCWRLTERGAKLAADYANIIDRAAAQVKDSVQRTFSIRPKAPRCAYCLEAITPDDRAVCECGSEVHALCLDEFCAGGSCVLRKTTARCTGHYRIIAKPVVVAAEAPVTTPAEGE